ncbi:protoporphyrinogen oxidase-like [Ixodes scapularis]|uniref:protoporphyrinogen oxidase-like n=1 Tax=Ixodes scapularis TaxID=6945 RepID=UPI001C38E2B1|nr:protoporphyrinogen oxidase-like [Ixodes scapularis]
MTHDWPELASMLLGIPTVHVASVNLEYKGKVLSQEAPGFLVPSREVPHVLSVLFDSCCFPEHDGQYDVKTRITCLLGGRWFKQQFGEVDAVDPQTLLESAQLAAQTYLGISQSPVRHSVDLLKDCLPQYLVGHVQKLSGIQQHIADRGLNLTPLGASYQGLGVNECIYNARLAVEGYLAKLRT